MSVTKLSFKSMLITKAVNDETLLEFEVTNQVGKYFGLYMMKN